MRGRNKSGGKRADLLGQFSSEKTTLTWRPPSKGVCTALPSTALVPAGHVAFSGSFHALTAQCRIIARGGVASMSTCNQVYRLQLLLDYSNSINYDKSILYLILIACLGDLSTNALIKPVQYGCSQC